MIPVLASTIAVVVVSPVRAIGRYAFVVDEAPAARGQREDDGCDCATHRYETLAFCEDLRIAAATAGPAASQDAKLAKPATPPTAFGSPARTIHTTNAHMRAS